MPRTCKKKHMKIPQVYRKFNEDHDDDSKKKKGGRKKTTWRWSAEKVSCKWLEETEWDEDDAEDAGNQSSVYKSFLDMRRQSWAPE